MSGLCAQVEIGMFRLGKVGQKMETGKVGRFFNRRVKAALKPIAAGECVSDGVGAKTHLLVCQTHPVKRHRKRCRHVGVISQFWFVPLCDTFQGPARCINAFITQPLKSKNHHRRLPVARSAPGKTTGWRCG